MLRTDLFKTKARSSTRVVAIRDTLTKPDPSIDASVIDALHCRRGAFGIGYHFLITTCGSIQLCRDIETIGAHSRDFDAISVSIGIVGGVDDEGDRLDTRTTPQREALNDLSAFLTVLYPAAKVHDRPDPQYP